MKFWLLAILTTLSWTGISSQLVNSQIKPINTSQNSSCPADLKTLTALMLEDLPNYANRVIQRTQILSNDKDDARYIIVAGKSEFEPLDLNQTQYRSNSQESAQQVFFTTLERQYFNNKILEVQNYHWLFLTDSPGGWRLVMMFSRLGSPSEGRSPLPPQETSDSVVGQAVSLWLRDCRAGAIR